jgi:hypothetical protein
MVATITGLALVFIFSLVYFESQGRKAASQIQTKLEHKSFLQSEIITVTVNGDTRKLLYLSCGARNCAGVDPETHIVQYFPQNGHSYSLPAEKSKQGS